MKRRIGMLALISCFVFAGCSAGDTAQNSSTGTMQESSSEPRNEATAIPESEQNDAAQAEEEIMQQEETMKLVIGKTEYEVKLDLNTTTTDIVSHLPLELHMERYAEHEYYAELPFTPVFHEERTSQIQAGHVYYWDGWNAFVINYIDWDISPYQVVHIGEITDAGISEVLSEAEDRILVSAENAEQKTEMVEEIKDPANAETTQITLTAGDIVISAELYDSKTSRQFLETLPRTLSMNRYGDREYYGKIEELSEDGEVISDFENGDVTYYPAGPSLAVFFANADDSIQPGLIRMGRIISDLSLFEEIGENAEIRIEAVQ